MSENSKNDLGKVLGLVLGREKCQLNCTPKLHSDFEPTTKDSYSLINIQLPCLLQFYRFLIPTSL